MRKGMHRNDRDSAQEMSRITIAIRQQQRMYAYQGLLLSFALVLFALALQYGLRDAGAVVGLAAVAAVAERGRVRLAGVTEASISLLPTVFAAAVLGPLAGLLVAAASFLGDFPYFLPGPRRAEAFARGGPFL